MSYAAAAAAAAAAAHLPPPPPAVTRQAPPPPPPPRPYSVITSVQSVGDRHMLFLADGNTDPHVVITMASDDLDYAVFMVCSNSDKPLPHQIKKLHINSTTHVLVNGQTLPPVAELTVVVSCLFVVEKSAIVHDPRFSRIPCFPTPLQNNGHHNILMFEAHGGHPHRWLCKLLGKNPVAKLDTPEKRAAGPIHRNVYKIKHSNGIHHPERVVFPICIRRCVSDVLYDFLVAELKEVDDLDEVVESRADFVDYFPVEVNDKRYYITPRLWSRVLIRKTQKPVANVPLTIAEHIECRLALADYFFERRGPSL